MQSPWSRWQHQWCIACIDGDGHGNCRLPVDDECAIRVHADVIEQACMKESGRSAGVEEIRDRVCAVCGQREADGTCWKRNRLECAFDRFLPAILETLEGHPAGSA